MTSRLNNSNETLSPTSDSLCTDESMQSPYYNYMNDDGHPSPGSKEKTPIGVISNAMSQKKAFSIAPAGLKKLKDKNEKMEDAISEKEE